MSTEEIELAAIEAPKSAALSQIRSFVGGGVGGVCAVLTGHPFDLVKVRLQTSEAGVYKGAMDVVRTTIAREGPIRVRSRLPRFSASPRYLAANPF